MSTATVATSTTATAKDRLLGRKARKRDAAVAAAAQLAAVPTLEHPLVGLAIGSLERKFGLMTSEDVVRVSEVLATSGDLAVADRMAFIAAMERRTPIVVIEVEGWFVACATNIPVQPAQLAIMGRPVQQPPRIMSIVSDRGIMPALGPLSA